MNSLAAACTAALVACALATFAPAQTSLSSEGQAQSSRPGAENPIRNPQNLTIFNSDDLALLAARNTVNATTILDIYAQNAALTQWGQTGQTIATDDPCGSTPRRRALQGRITTPRAAQPICLTGFGVSVYYEDPAIANGQKIAYAFELPDVGSEARSLDAEAGELDRSASVDELHHMEIATAIRDFNSALSVDIIGYTPGANGAVGSLGSVGSWTDNSGMRVAGDVALALGDFNNDTRLELVVAADTSTGATGPGRITLRVFSYDPDAKSLSVESSLDVTTDAPPRSVDLVSGDFAALGFDQLILGHYTTAAKSAVKLDYFHLPQDLSMSSPQVSRTLAAVPAAKSYFEMEAGLFHFDPKAINAGDAAFGFHVRQLAVAWVDMSGEVKTLIASMSPAATQIQESAAATMTGSGAKTLTQNMGPSLAVGNFIGIQSDNVSPLDQIAVAKANVVPGAPNQSISEIVVASPAYDTQTRQFSISQTFFDRQPTQQVSGLVFSPGLTALDSRGRSFYLGTPLHIQVPQMIDPQYVVYMPPRHVDCVGGETQGDAGDAPCEPLNLSGDTQFAVELVDSRDETLTQTSTDQMSSQFGADVNASITGTVGGGIAEIAEVEVTSTVKTNFSYETDTVERNVNTQYQSITTTRSATTNVDDHLIWNGRLLDIWRFPVYGMDLQQDKEHPYYDVMVPGPLARFSGGGRSMDWFGPRHINNNALSYFQISDANWPNDLGDFTFKTEEGSEKIASRPLNEGIERTFDGNSQNFALDYTTEVGGSTEKTFSYSLSNSTDISVGFKASAQFEIVNASTDIETGITLSNKSSWENSNLAERSLKNSRGITLSQPEVDGIADKSYNYKTYIYVTGTGGLKVAHATNLLGSASGRGWWLETYGGKADPALNLPNKFTFTQDGIWEITSGEQYFWMRGIYLTQAKKDETTDDYPLLTGGVDEGTDVRVVVRVYNLSVNTNATDVRVQYAYQPLDSSTLKPTGDAKVFATSQPLSLEPQALKEIDAIWSTTGLAGDAGTPYRFEITLLTDGNEIHGDDQDQGGNNKGLWPWAGSSFSVFKSGSRASLDGLPTRQPAPQMDLELIRTAAIPGASHLARIDLTAFGDDALGRQLVLIQPPETPDGIWHALASRTLWGLRAGTQRLEIPVLAENVLTRPVRAWLSPSPADLGPMGTLVSGHAPWILSRR